MEIRSLRFTRSKPRSHDGTWEPRFGPYCRFHSTIDKNKVKCTFNMKFTTGPRLMLLQRHTFRQNSRPFAVTRCVLHRISFLVWRGVKGHVILNTKDFNFSSLLFFRSFWPTKQNLIYYKQLTSNSFPAKRWQTLLSTPSCV
jgi:hypothetical protein